MLGRVHRGASLAVQCPTRLPLRATSIPNHLPFEHLNTSFAPTFFNHFLPTSEPQFLPSSPPALLIFVQQCCCWPHPPVCLVLHAILLIFALRLNLKTTWNSNPELYVQVFHTHNTFLGRSMGNVLRVWLPLVIALLCCTESFHYWACCIVIWLPIYCHQGCYLRLPLFCWLFCMYFPYQIDPMRFSQNIVYFNVFQA